MIKQWSEQRRHQRYAVEWRARLIVGSGGYDIARDTVACAVLNISAGGAKVSLDLLPQWLSARLDACAVGLPVSLVLTTLAPLAGKIAWRRDRDIGIRFDSAFHVALHMRPLTEAAEMERKPARVTYTSLWFVRRFRYQAEVA